MLDRENKFLLLLYILDKAELRLVLQTAKLLLLSRRKGHITRGLFLVSFYFPYKSHTHLTLKS